MQNSALHNGDCDSSSGAIFFCVVTLVLLSIYRSQWDLGDQKISIHALWSMCPLARWFIIAICFNRFRYSSSLEWFGESKEQTTTQRSGYIWAGRFIDRDNSFSAPLGPVTVGWTDKKKNAHTYSIWHPAMDGTVRKGVSLNGVRWKFIGVWVLGNTLRYVLTFAATIDVQLATSILFSWHSLSSIFFLADQ